MSFHCAAKLNEVWHVPVRFDKLGLSGDVHECFTEMSVAQDQKSFETWLQPPPPSGICSLFIVNSVWPCTRQRVCFKDVTPNFLKKDMLQLLSRRCVKYFLCSLKEKWLYCVYLCMTSSRTDVCQFHPSLHWHTEMAWYMEDLRPL